MRTIIFLLAVAGIVVSSLAWQIHYSNKVQPCDINAHWDCGIVNHSRYSMIRQVPVAAVGVAGYLLIALLALFRKRRWTLIFALIGLGFALYLSHIEASILEVWCLYCAISQGIIALIAILAAADLARGSRTRPDSASAR
ncbi:MAG: vitamin K epoxide reductase family protein [Bryobacteraceae bacterium]